MLKKKNNSLEYILFWIVIKGLVHQKMKDVFNEIKNSD